MEIKLKGGATAMLVKVPQYGTVFEQNYNKYSRTKINHSVKCVNKQFRLLAAVPFDFLVQICWINLEVY